MKNIFRLFWAALFAFSMAACSIEEEPAAPANDASGKIYVTFKISLPGTRSATDEEGESNSNANPEVEVGKTDENKVSYVQLVLLECTTDATTAAVDDDVMTDKVIAVSTKEPTLVSGNQYTVAFKSEDLVQAAGSEARKIRVVAYCNHSSSAQVGTKLEDLYDEKVGEDHFTDARPEGMWCPNYFWMTNANRDHWDSDAKLLPPKDELVGHNVPSEALDLGVIEVERTAARIDFAAGGEEGNTHMYLVESMKDSEGNTVGEVYVTLSDMALFQTSRECFKLRRVSPHGTATGWQLFGDEKPDNYVVDTDWERKEDVGRIPIPGNDRAYVQPQFEKIDNGIDQLPLSEGKSSINYQYHIWHYIPENTIPSGIVQERRFATRVIFRGSLTATGSVGEDIAAKKYLYVFNNHMYGSWERVLEAADAELVTDRPLLRAAVDQAIDLYRLENPNYTGDIPGVNEGETGWRRVAESVGFRLYGPEYANKHQIDYDFGLYSIFYDCYIRHNNNYNPHVSGPMEFAVVRNNVYKLAVIKINGYGDDDYELPLPGEPIEKEDTFFKVQVKVLPWVVRLNEIAFDEEGQGQEYNG